ncbi:hypothetical protein ACH5RR_017440 [Cinchona calisaya]|uniref:Uncharacterized protein n=1 Tax=Cinchona calisaya TaxID=153742 RepID=A0ABD2ZII7_9GENT
MATKSDQQAALHSSIALLQERFKRLQKIREMRQERELLRLLSETRERRRTSSPSTMQYDQPSNAATTLYNSEMMIFHQTPSYSQPALSLWPDSQMKHGLDDHTIGNTSAPFMDKFDDSSSDVDTSLHL